MCFIYKYFIAPMVVQPYPRDHDLKKKNWIYPYPRMLKISEQIVFEKKMLTDIPM